MVTALGDVVTPVRSGLIEVPPSSPSFLELKKLRVKQGNISPRVDSGNRLDQWQGFSRRRHLMNPPDVYNENDFKFEKLTGGAKSEQGAKTERAMLDEKEEGKVDAEIRMRKARFFDGCLRADRVTASPRLPKLPMSAREASDRIAALVAAKTRATAEQLMLTGVETSPRPKRAPSKPAGLTIPEASLAATHSSFSSVTAVPAPFETLPTGQKASISPTVSLQESLGDYMSCCRIAKIHPATTGIIRASSDILRLEYGSMTDRRAEAAAHVLKAAARDVKRACFRSNGLTDCGVRHLLEALPDTLHAIDLSQNCLGYSPSWCKSLSRLLRLRELSIVDGQLGDAVCKSVCEAIATLKYLNVLRLGGNELHGAGRAIGTFLGGHLAVEELDVRWNNISGEPARELLRGMQENWHIGGALRKVDLSWNPLGKLGGEETIKLIAAYIRENETVTHLDLSKCDLKLSHCKLVGEALDQNKSILGLHIDGNEATIDGQCRLVLGSVMGQTSGAETAEILDERGARKCWVCGGWREVQLRYRPGMSGLSDVAMNDMWVFTSVDNFAYPNPMTKQKNGDMVACVMAPAGRLGFVFQSGIDIVLSRTAPRLEMKPPLRLRRALVPSAAAMATAPATIGDEAELGVADPLMVEVTHMNAYMIEARRGDEAVCKHSVPRRLGLEDNLPLSPWSLETSFFASVGTESAAFEDTHERRTLCDAALAADWGASRVPHLVGDEEDRFEVRYLLRDNYDDIQALYASLCVVDIPDFEDVADPPLNFGVNLYSYTHFLANYFIASEDFLSMEEADAYFICAALPSKTSECHVHGANDGGGIVLHRHSFVELLVRIAVHHAKKVAQAKGTKYMVGLSLRHVLEKHLRHPLPIKDFNWRCAQWRKYVLRTEIVEKVYQRHMKATIDPLFNLYAQTPTSHPPYLRPVDFLAMLDALRVFMCGVSGDEDVGDMNQWDRSWIWQVSVGLHADELLSDAHLQLNFSGYLEALGRLAALMQARDFIARATPEQRAKWEYGMGACAPASIFSADQEHIMDPEAFATILERFMKSPAMQRAVNTPRVQPLIQRGHGGVTMETQV